MLGIRTRGRSMVGADDTTELWQPSTHNNCCLINVISKLPMTGFEPGLSSIGGNQPANRAYITGQNFQF